MNKIGEVARVVVAFSMPLNLAFLLFSDKIKNKVWRKTLFFSGIILAWGGFYVWLFSPELMQLWEASRWYQQ